MQKGWFFWDPQRRLRKLLSLDYDEFLESAQELFATKLSKAAGRKIKLQRLMIASVDVTVYRKRELRGGGFNLLARIMNGFKASHIYKWTGKVEDFNTDTLQEIVEHDFEIKLQPEKSGSAEWARFEKVEFGRDVLPDFLRSLDVNKAVDVALVDVFVQQNGEHGTHAISLVGTYFERDDGALKGFKYVNSWSTQAVAKGFGYLSRDLLESYFVQGIIVRAVNLAKMQ